MNKVHKKIRALRKLRDWSQETMAELLSMSPGAYINIEKGKTDVPLSRLEQIAQVLEVEVADLFILDKGVIFKPSIHNSNTANHSQLVNSPCTTAPNLEHELEKAQLVMEQQQKELAYLKEIIELMKKTRTAD